MDRRVNTAVSGGGHKMATYGLGVFEAFDEYGIKPEHIAATSFGAVIGAMVVAACYDAYERKDIYVSTVRPEILFGREVGDAWHNLNSDERLNMIIAQRDSNSHVPIMEALSERINIEKVKNSDTGYAVTTTEMPIAHTPMGKINVGKMKGVPINLAASKLVPIFRKGHTIDKKDMTTQNMAQYITASNANPFAFGSGVEIDGVEHWDGGLSDQIALGALQKTSRPADVTFSIQTPFGVEAVEQKKVTKQYRDSGRLVEIRPDEFGPLPANTFDFGYKVDEMIQRGHDDASRIIERNADLIFGNPHDL